MIRVSGVTKSFGSKVAVDQVSFSVEKGEILGLLGPNGAGKSTLLRMMTGYLLPDEGSVSLDGFDLLRNPIQAKSTFGYLPESASCYSQMTVTEYLTYLLELRGTPPETRMKQIEEAIRICYLDSVRNQIIETLSKGFTHRVCLAQSLAHDPDIFVFDEPTDGLDPNQKKEVRELIVKRSVKKAIIFSSHILEEVEAICTKVIVMSEGKIVFTGSPQEVKRLYSNWNTIHLILNESDETEALTSLRKLKSVQKAELRNELGEGYYEVSLGESFDDFVRELPAALDRSNGKIEAIRPASDGLARGFSLLTTS